MRDFMPGWPFKRVCSVNSIVLMNSDVFRGLRWPIHDGITFLNRPFERPPDAPLPLYIFLQTVFPISLTFFISFLPILPLSQTPPTFRSHASKLHSYWHRWVTSDQNQIFFPSGFSTPRKTTCFKVNDARKGWSEYFFAKVLAEKYLSFQLESCGKALWVREVEVRHRRRAAIYTHQWVPHCGPSNSSGLRVRSAGKNTNFQLLNYALFAPTILFR